MPHIMFMAAGALAAVWFLVHVFIGGREIARPLVQATGLAPQVRHTQYLCWHFTSVGIACMSGLFFASAFGGPSAFATSATLMAAGFCGVGVALVISIGESHARLPQGWLFLPVTALGVIGHLM